MSFRFLDLPAEMRMMIYRVMFKHHEDVYIMDHRAKPKTFSKLARRLGRIPEAPFGGFWGILRANRQIYDEACRVIYTENFFNTPDPDDPGYCLAAHLFEHRLNQYPTKQMRRIRKEISLRFTIDLDSRLTNSPSSHTLFRNEKFYRRSRRSLHWLAFDLKMNFLDKIIDRTVALEVVELYMVRGQENMIKLRWAMVAFLEELRRIIRTDIRYFTNRTRILPESFDDFEMLPSANNTILTVVLSRTDSRVS